MKNFKARIKTLDKWLKSSTKRLDARQRLDKIWHELISDATGDSVEVVAAAVGHVKYNTLAEFVMDGDDHEEF